MSVPRLVTAKQPRLYLNMGTDGTMDLAGAGRAPAASTSLEGTGVVQPLHTSRKGKKQLKPDTAGAAWGHMTAKGLTPELKRDLQIIRMRGVLDPKRFYRSSDMKKELPKYFQVGTLIGGAEDAGDCGPAGRSVPRPSPFACPLLVYAAPFGGRAPYRRCRARARIK